ncbi:MAG: flagellar basal body L-ring protein FlgH [Alphaproteobacteria bacterium]|nr:MAG: flagellar basal body L-ring protein FlgH [Alphaproteobacteria bacterium]
MTSRTPCHRHRSFAPRSRPVRLLPGRPLPVLALALLSLALSGCNALTRLSQVGEEPPLTRIENPAKLHDNQPVAMPMPPPVPVERQANSLWRPGSRAFLKDQRASQVGDILTVVIDIKDEAKISNTTTRSRDNAENANASSFLGYEQSLGQILPEAVDPTSLIDLGSTSSSQGSGSINRDEDISLRIAALVTQVLPNGNLVIAGQQEVRVNFEVRHLQVAGIIRPEDITSGNTIKYDQIAEARIAYGGRGQITDVQQPRYGQQIYDILWPF